MKKEAILRVKIMGYGSLKSNGSELRKNEGKVTRVIVVERKKNVPGTWVLQLSCPKKRSRGCKVLSPLLIDMLTTDGNRKDAHS